ncbi:MAG: hypothetical protein JWR00_2339 [Rubritepida sp.]|nr:hypothetical protein [Rubritepida sp.]
MSRIARRALLATGATALAAPAIAQSWMPSRSITLLIPFAAGDLLWQFVGVARSAAGHEARGGKRLWAFLARGVLVVALIGLPFVVADDVTMLRRRLG